MEYAAHKHLLLRLQEVFRPSTSPRQGKSNAEMNWLEKPCSSSNSGLFPEFAMELVALASLIDNKRCRTAVRTDREQVRDTNLGANNYQY